MIASKLLNINIKWKLILIIMATCLPALILSGSTFIVLERIFLHRFMAHNLLTQAGVIADNCKAALAFKDAKDAEEILKSLHAEPSIVFAYIHTNNGEVFARYDRNENSESSPPNKPKEDGCFFNDGLLTASKIIVLDKEAIGSVSIRSDLYPMYEMLRRNASITIAVILFASLIAFLLSSALQKVISKPILSLTDAAKEVSKKKDYSSRALKNSNSNDEIGLLIDAFNKMLEQIQQRDKELVERTVELITSNEQLTREVDERKRAKAELQTVQDKLIRIARQTGMAEVATDVLHNVGNVLASVNITAESIQKRVRDSKVSYLADVVGLLEEHAENLGNFITNEERGRKLPAFLASLSQELIAEKERSLDTLDTLTKHIEHLTEIIQLQQSYSKITSIVEPVSVADVIEDAIHINAESLKRHYVKIKREFADLPVVLLDSHKILQIMTNLINNARYAMSNSGRDDKILTIRITEPQNGHFRIEVQDNGIGIIKKDLTRIFEHGFTTKKDGHGFGLHSSAIAAKEMSGLLTVHSDGPGKGTVLTLELPFKVQEIQKSG